MENGTDFAKLLTIGMITECGNLHYPKSWRNTPYERKYAIPNC